MAGVRSAGTSVEATVGGVGWSVESLVESTVTLSSGPLWAESSSGGVVAIRLRHA